MLSALANIALGIAVVVLITAFTAYFVAQEFAYTAVNRSRLTVAAQMGDAAAQRALAVTRRTSFMLSGASRPTRVEPPHHPSARQRSTGTG